MRVLSLLASGPHTVTEIARGTGVALCNLSHHLIVLKESGFIRGERQGRFVRYSLRPGVFQSADGQAAGRVLNLGCCQLVFPTGNDEIRVAT
jgi:DNA-binding transcriptional ArsR family regulator